MNALLLLNSLSIRLNEPKSNSIGFTVNWKIIDTKESCHTELTNSVLINREGESSEAEATVELSRAVLSLFALGEFGLAELKQSDSRILGDESVVIRLVEMLDHFPAWFPIATHDLKFEENAGEES
jgi:alkyl sulfatase BDS1-like metallo-beta-lactamase superfamily hydrolase